VKPITEIILIAVFTTIILWFLDTYYLWQKRKFKGLYDDIADNKIFLYKMPMQEYVYDKSDKKKKYSYLNVFKSQTIILFYFPTIVLLLVIYGLLKFVI
jgi:hypothetical protein